MRLLPAGRRKPVLFLPRRTEPRLLPPSPFTAAEYPALVAVRDRFTTLTPDDDPIGDSEMRRLRFYRWMVAAGRLHDGGTATEADRRMSRRAAGLPPLPPVAPLPRMLPSLHPSLANLSAFTRSLKGGQYNGPFQFYRVHGLPFPPSRRDPQGQDGRQAS